MTSKSVGYDRGSPIIHVVNESADVDPVMLQRILRAVQKQVDDDFFPLWGWRARIEVSKDAKDLKAMHILIREKPDVKNADGYHFSDSGLPTTCIFTRDGDGNLVDEYSTTLSHEVLEMIVDPGVNLYAAGFYWTPKRTHRRAWIPYEVCDPVQGCTYEINGVPVSDFVVPEWFEPERADVAADYSFLGSVRRPFKLAKGGYVDAVVGDTIRTRWGRSANRKKTRHRRQARVKAGKLRG